MSDVITKLKLNMFKDSKLTFFYTILFSLDVHIDNLIPSACTDGNFLKFNEAFLARLSKEEQLFLVVHECMHVALSHMTRLADRQPGKWNAACDYAINYDLTQAGYTMPKGEAAGLLDSNYANITADEIYKLLPDSPDDYGYDQDKGDMIFVDPDSPEGKELAQKLEEGLLRAEAAAKMSGQTEGIGTISGDLSRMLDKLLNPKLPWKVILQNHMNDHAEDDYTMLFPDEEYMPELYLPTLYSEGMGAVSIYVDVSGSISDKDVDIALTEINYLKESLKPRKTKLVSFDVDIHLCVEYDQYDPIGINGLNVAGGGGTSLRGVAKQIKKDNPKVTVIITDGYLEPNEVKHLKNTDFIWLIFDNENFTAPIGKVIHINTDEYTQ